MNLIIKVVLIAVLGSVAQYNLPWWSAVLVALLVELVLGRSNRLSFFSGFYGICIPWMVLAAYIDICNGSLLSVRILDLFHLPQFSLILVVLTGLVGGLAGGTGSLAGGWLRNAILKRT